MDSIYWVLIASLVVWGGIFFYLVNTDNKVSRIEKRLDQEGR